MILKLLCTFKLSINQLLKQGNFFIIVMIIGINLILGCFIIKSAIPKNGMDLIFTMCYLKVFLVCEIFKRIYKKHQVS